MTVDEELLRDAEQIVHEPVEAISLVESVKASRGEIEARAGALVPSALNAAFADLI